MEIIIQHTDEIYKNFFIGITIILLFASLPAISQWIKCKYKFEEYKRKDKLLWIIPLVCFIFIFSNSGLYMIDYMFDRIDVQTVYIESVRGYNGGCYLFSENHKFDVINHLYDSDKHVVFIMKDEVEGHWCEIESYKTWNDVIRIKVLD